MNAVIRQSCFRRRNFTALVPQHRSSKLISTRIRTFQSERFTPSSSQTLLATQRKNRPISPHLSIYRPQINYFTSPFHRITGCIVSGIFYVFGAGYLVAPSFGFHLDTESFVAWFGSLPVAVKIASKWALAFPFTFHCFNGVGHMVWDTGRNFTPRGIVAQGWTVLITSILASGYLALI